MGINIRFFEKEHAFDKRAFGKGIYVIKLQKKNNPEKKPITLYIGQSVWIIVRCAGHLYRTFKEPEYLGLTRENLEDDSLELVVQVLEAVETKENLREREKHYIRQERPLTQYDNNDKQISNKCEIVQKAIEALSETK